jgi:hypothetical protein
VFWGLYRHHDSLQEVGVVLRKNRDSGCGFLYDVRESEACLKRRKQNVAGVGLQTEDDGRSREKRVSDISGSGVDESKSQGMSSDTELPRLYGRGSDVHSLKEMDPQRIRELLDAQDEKGGLLYPDILTPLVEKEAELFRNSSCPKCGALAPTPILNTHRPFVPNSPLPNKILRCVVCGTEFDPRTGLITLASIIDVSG